MNRNLHLVIHLGRKVAVRSVNKDAEIELPPFYKDDQIQLAFSLVQDKDDPTAEAPFDLVDTTGWDLRCAIGNALTGTGRLLLGQTLSFARDLEGTYSGELSLRTEAAALFLAQPDLYVSLTSYEIGDLVRFDGLTYERVAEESDNVPEGSPSSAPSLWSSSEHFQDPLFFEVAVVRPEGMETILQMPCTVVERVIQQPPVAPELMENMDALADAMASRLGPSSSIVWEHNRDSNDPNGNPAAPYDPAVVVPYLGRVYDTLTRRYYQALREIKRPVGLKAVGDVALDHLPGFIDGSIASQHERLALFEQSDTKENGVYTVEGVGADLKPDGARFNVANPDGKGRFTINPTGDKLYYVDLAVGETVTCFNQSLTVSGTLQADPGRVITIYGVYGALIQTVVRAAGAVRATDLIRVEDQAPGTVLWVSHGNANVGKRFSLEQPGFGELAESWQEMTGATGPFGVTEPAFFAEMAHGYSSPEYDADIAYNVGDPVQWEGRTFVAHTAPPPGELPSSRLYWGQLLEFIPGAHLVASVRVAPGAGLKVSERGVEVDFSAISADTFDADSEETMLLLAAKVGDYAIRTDLLGRPYRLKATPATDLENWVSLDAESIASGAYIPVQSRYRTASWATLTTQVPHGLVTGNQVSITGVGGTGFNMVGVTIEVHAEDAFHYTSPGPDEIPTVQDTAGFVRQLIPVVTRPVSLSSQLPAFLPVGAMGAVGTGQRAAREDHVHPMPGLASVTASGFISPAQFALLEGLGSSSGTEVGFDLPVDCLMVVDSKVWVGGQFTRYGTNPRARIAVLDGQGRVDAGFDPGTGFTQPVSHLAMTLDGVVVVGSSIYNNYRGLAGGHVWKLNPDGTPWAGWNCPFPLSDTGPNTLVGLTTAGSAIIAISPGRLRILSAVGADVVNATSNAPLYDVLGYDSTVFLSGAAFAAGGQDALVNGLIPPKALKLLGVEPTIACPCLAGTNVPSFSTGAGDGANASVRRLALYRSYDGDFVIGGTPRIATEDDGTDHAWNNGNALRFRGLYRIRLDGLADDGFEIDLTLSEVGAAIPFACDSLGRIYFGGPVSAIGGVAVTPWRLYRISSTGEFDREFAGFDDKVHCAALLNDDNLVVGGAFTRYGARPAGRITFLNASGDVVTPDGGQPMGRVVTRTDLPNVAADSRTQYDLVRLLPSSSAQTVSLWIYDPNLGWMDLCSVCRIQGDLLPTVLFDPPSGSAVGAGISVSLRAVGFLQATIRYTLDGTNPTLDSPTYSTPIAITVPTTIKAFASLPGGRADGPLSVAQYDVAILVRLPPPTISPASGEPPVTVTLATPVAHPDATLRYTLNGSAAGETSILYEGPFSITSNTTLRVVAIKPGLLTSQEVSVTYETLMPPPVPRYVAWRSVSEDSLIIEVVGAGTGSLTGVNVEFRVSRLGANLGPWKALTDGANFPTAQGRLLLRSNASYVYGTTCDVSLRTRQQRGVTSVYSEVVEVHYVGAPYKP